MNHIYIGDRELDPPDDEHFECMQCGKIYVHIAAFKYHVSVCNPDEESYDAGIGEYYE